ncbi:MAG: branched-chain amino acid ABC transporter substrate-binding protein [Dehalococcoidia bacterium]
MLSAVALASVVGAACGGDDDDDDDATPTGGAVAGGFTDAGYKLAGFKKVTIDKGGTIKIGISSALSGDVKGLGEPIAASAEAALKDATVKGFKIEVVKEDDLCSAEGGPAAADRLVKAGVVAAVGPICSGGTRASLAIYDKAGITHISPSATSGDLTSPARPEGPYVTFFRVPVLNGDEAKAQADYALKELKAKTAFIIFDTDDYGKDLSTQFKTEFEKAGGKIVGAPTGYEKKQGDFKSVITNIKAAKPDVVYHAGFYAEATTFLQQLRGESDLKAVPFLSGDGVKNDELLKGAKDAIEGAILALPGDRGAGFEAYKAKFKDAESATFGGEAYDAATIILKALESVAKQSGDKLEIDLKELNTAIKNTNLTGGATGNIKFGPNGNRGGAVVKFFQVKNGAFVEIAKK